MNRSRACLRRRSDFRHPPRADRQNHSAPVFPMPRPATPRGLSLATPRVLSLAAPLTPSPGSSLTSSSGSSSISTVPGRRRVGEQQRAFPFRFIMLLLSVSVSVLAAGCQRNDLKLPESIRQKIAESNRSASQTKAMTPLPIVPSDGVSSRFTVRPFEDWTMREAAAVALSRIGEPAVPALVEALQSPDPNLRQQAADTLARIGPAASTAVPALTALLDDPDPRVKKSAVRALGQIGPAAATAVPSLMRALE